MSAKSGLQQPNLGTLNKCVGRECQTGHVRIDFADADMNRPWSLLLFGKKLTAFRCYMTFLNLRYSRVWELDFSG